MSDPVNAPAHYTSHPSGVECWQISAHLPHPLASAFEYVFRHRDKDQPVEDLRKAIKWLEFERLRRREIVTQGHIVPVAIERMERMLEAGHHSGAALDRIMFAAINWMNDDILTAAEQEVRRLLQMEMADQYAGELPW